MSLISFGYIIGVNFKFTDHVPWVIDEHRSTLSAFEYFSLLINFILAFFALLTIAVALLKDEIVSIWKKVMFSAELESECGFIENINNRNDASSSADNYQLKVNVTNDGTINALNCKIIISKVFHTNINSSHRREIKLSKTMHPQLENQIIPPSTSFEIMLAEINLKRDNSDNNTEQKKTTLEPIFFIAGNIIDPECHAGVIEVHFSIHCDSTESLKRIIEIKWDGVWKNRLTDIKPHLQATFKNKVK
ncbi:hypothetical protein [Aeromonas salmonicida]|jgi:hypothetical protein|uniref:hypothetical protein n=1 Tax=Aeromonas salmonicida TaxID=645 RepID=UPI003D1B5C39